MTKISSKHLIFFILGISAISLRTYASIIVRIGGRDAWISTFIAGLFFVLFVFLIVFVTAKTNTLNIKDVFLKTFPKFIGWIFLGLFTLGLFLTSIEAACVQSSSLHTNSFLETPLWYCLLFFIIPAGYISTKSFRTILSIVLITVAAVFVSNIIISLLLFKYMNFDYILPILFNGLSKELLISTVLAFGSLSSVAIVFPFIKNICDPENLVKNSLIAVILIVISSTFSIFSIIETFGALRGGNLFYPEFVQSQLLQIEGFMECGELFYLFRTVLMFLLKYILSLTAIITLFKDKIKHKKRFVIGYSIIAYFICLYISTSQYFLFNILRYLQIILLVVFLIIPLLSYIIYYLKCRKANFKNIPDNEENI